MIKSRRNKWAGHVANIAKRGGPYRVLVGKLEGKSPLGNPGVDGRVIIKLILKKWDVGA